MHAHYEMRKKVEKQTGGWNWKLKISSKMFSATLSQSFSNVCVINYDEHIN